MRLTDSIALGFIAIGFATIAVGVAREVATDVATVPALLTGVLIGLLVGPLGRGLTQVFTGEKHNED